MRKKGRVTRIDDDFLRDLEEVKLFRISNKMDKPKELSDREITRMMRNAQIYPDLLNELKLKPRKKIIW